MNAFLAYVGFGSVEQLLCDLPADQPRLYLDKVFEPTSSPQYAGLIRFTGVVYVQAVLPDLASVHYARIPFGGHDESCGQEMTPGSREKLEKRGDSLLELVRRASQKLGPRGMRLVEAMVAMPRDFRLMDGTCRSARYDEPTDRFVPAEVELEPQARAEGRTP